MKTLRVTRDLPWIPQPNAAKMVLTAVMPPQELITSVGVLAFGESPNGQCVLMTRLAKRGWPKRVWDIPGGHCETGETPFGTLRREVMEEAAAELGEIQILGHWHVNVTAPKPADYKYPYPDSYMLLCVASVRNLLPFEPTEEAEARRLFTPNEAKELAWVQKNWDIYEAALLVIGNQSSAISL
ncbi:MAG: NUDIX domain-containing protein [Chloroflexota bacterium]